MLCQICQKKDATVHFTQIESDTVIKMHLCEDCAKEKGIGIKPPGLLGNLVSSLSDLEDKAGEGSVHCPQCGLGFQEFHKAGRLGCGRCYETFSESLSPLIKTLHKGDHHVGKVPVAHPPEEEKPDLGRLRKELRVAVEKEEFEKAAELRDAIRKLSKSARPSSRKSSRRRNG